MNPQTAMVLGAVSEFNGWCVKETRLLGSIMLRSADFPKVAVYATPNWNENDTLTISIEHEDGDHVHAFEVPVPWPRDPAEVAALWKQIMHDIWDKILGVVREVAAKPEGK